MTADATLYRDLAYVFGAAMLGGAVARKLQQPLILGYVVGGILISPFTPGPTVSDVHSLELFAEIGVILLMFSIGIEFHVKDLLKVKWVAIGGGTLGILGSMLLGVGVGRWMGWTPNEGLVIGAIISVASTMVLARFLLDRGELHTDRGRVMIAITLFEDVAVVILTVVIPSLGQPGDAAWKSAGVSLLKAVLLLGPLGFAAAKLVPPLLSRLMRVHSPELFMVIILAVCMGTAAITQAIGLSLALGAFMAGLVINGSAYAREALGSLLPVRDAFVALFFVTVGMLIDPRALLANVPLLLVLVAMIVAGKAVIWTSVVRVFGYPFWTAAGVALGLTQIGEFSFILAQVGRSSGLLSNEVYNATLAASLVTILLNALIWRFGMRLVDRAGEAASAMETGEAPGGLHGHVVICGFGRMGGSAGAALDAFDKPYVVIEFDAGVVRGVRQRNLPCVFGDTSRGAVLEAAHASSASLVLVTIPDIDHAYLTTRAVRALNPSVPILARAHRRADFELLMQAGATTVVQPETEASATLIGEALERAGVPEEQALAYLSQFRAAMALATPKLAGRRNALPELREVTAEQVGAAGKSLRDSRLREDLGITVVRVTRRSGESVLVPPPDMLLAPGDVLHVLGLQEDLDRAGAGEPASG